jgi:DNA mismatch repair protein MutS
MTPKELWDARVSEQALKDAGNELVFVRAGDFYETFSEHAKVAARVLGLALTSRAKGDGALAMCGFPYHYLDGYVAKLVAAGYRVVIIDQAASAKSAVA